MNVVVTIPQSRMDDIRKEEEDMRERLARGEECSYFWSLSRKPKDLRLGDRMYFVWDNAVRSFHYVIGFKEDLTCETTGRKYKGCCVVLGPKEHEIVPIPMKPFRGYQYFTTPVRERELPESQTTLSLTERFKALLAEFEGSNSTPFVWTQIEAKLQQAVHEMSGQDAAEWFSVDAGPAEGDEVNLVITPHNIFAALLLTGHENPPLKTVACQKYETDEYVFEMVEGKVVARKKPNPLLAPMIESGMDLMAFAPHCDLCGEVLDPSTYHKHQAGLVCENCWARERWI